jgi:uncharacterized protein YlaI
MQNKYDDPVLLNFNELKKQIERLKFMLKIYNCFECDHWIEEGTEKTKQTCGKFKMRPPTKVIVSGCEYFSEKIPF